MKKAVAIPYIIALVLGIAVIGLIGFWLVSSGGKFGSQSSKTACDNKFLQRCITSPEKPFSEYAPECVGVTSYTECSQVLGTGGGTGSCTPKTCLELGKQCGSWDNGCGTGTITCDPCTSPKVCQNGICTSPACKGEGVQCTPLVHTECCDKSCEYDDSISVWKC